MSIALSDSESDKMRPDNLKFLLKYLHQKITQFI